MKQESKPDGILDQSALEKPGSSKLTHNVMLPRSDVAKPLRIKSQSSWDKKVVWTTDENAAVVTETQSIEPRSDMKR